MGLYRFLFLTLVWAGMAFSPAAAMAAPRCAALFSQLEGLDFPIEIGGRNSSRAYLTAAHDKLIAEFEMPQLTKVLKIIRDSGLESLTPKQRKRIVKFRQHASFMRSIFQTSEKDHGSPREFAKFVRDFGVLKDLVLMNDAVGARDMAKQILRKYSELDFEALLKDAKPASRRSVSRYFLEVLNDSRVLMHKRDVTVDEMHDVRKNLRDVLRYLQIQNQVRQESLGNSGRIEDTPQIAYLKRINDDLGRICDEHAARILRNEITDETIVRFPQEIRTQIEYFLNNATVIVDGT